MINNAEKGNEDTIMVLIDVKMLRCGALIVSLNDTGYPSMAQTIEPSMLEPCNSWEVNIIYIIGKQLSA